MRKTEVSELMRREGPGGAKGEHGGAPGTIVRLAGSSTFPSTGTVVLTYGQGS